MRKLHIASVFIHISTSNILKEKENNTVLYMFFLLKCIHLHQYSEKEENIIILIFQMRKARQKEIK